jgi:hypothetical protein
LQDYLAHSFLDCIVGDTDLKYDARSRLLVRRSHSGEVVGTMFSIPHRIRVKVRAPQREATPYDKLVPLSRIHEYRMDATLEDILSISTVASDPELDQAKKRAALLYHPDKFPSLTEELQRILTRRMQEVSEAFAEIRAKREPRV